MKKRFFPDGSQEAARIESLEQVIEDAEKDDTKPGALRDRNNAHAEWVTYFVKKDLLT